MATNYRYSEGGIYTASRDLGKYVVICGHSYGFVLCSVHRSFETAQKRAERLRRLTKRPGLYDYVVGIRLERGDD